MFDEAQNSRQVGHKVDGKFVQKQMPAGDYEVAQSAIQHRRPLNRVSIYASILAYGIPTVSSNPRNPKRVRVIMDKVITVPFYTYARIT